MAPTYTAVISQDGPWWVGWVEEVPGVNAQEQSRDELLVRKIHLAPAPETYTLTISTELLEAP